MTKQGLMSNIISSDLAVFGIFQEEFGTNEKIRKSAFQDEFLGKNKNVRPLTTFKICCTEFTPSEKISLNLEIWTRVLKHPVELTRLIASVPEEVQDINFSDVGS